MDGNELLKAFSHESQTDDDLSTQSNPGRGQGQKTEDRVEKWLKRCVGEFV